MEDECERIESKSVCMKKREREKSTPKRRERERARVSVRAQTSKRREDWLSSSSSPLTSSIRHLQENIGPDDVNAVNAPQRHSLPIHPSPFSHIQEEKVGG